MNQIFDKVDNVILKIKNASKTAAKISKFIGGISDWLSRIPTFSQNTDSTVQGEPDSSS